MSSGASVNAHYCKDKMVDWAFFKKAKACKMKPAAISANINKEKDYITETHCCSERDAVLKQTIETKAQKLQSKEFQPVRIGIRYLFSDNLNWSDIKVIKSTYKPPPLFKSRPLKTFLSVIQVLVI